MRGPPAYYNLDGVARLSIQPGGLAAQHPKTTQQHPVFSSRHPAQPGTESVRPPHVVEMAPRAWWSWSSLLSAAPRTGAG
jgi:hypothetical protein